jgi:hypothetical protein
VKTSALTFAIAIAIVVALVVLSACPASAQTIVEPSTGTTFLQRPSTGGKTYLCLGAGNRKYLLWDLYAMDMCVEEAETRPALDRYFAGAGQAHASQKGPPLAKALADDQGFFDWLAALPVAKRAEMVFLRGADADTARNGFAKNLEKFLGSGDPEKAAIRAFVAAIDRAVVSGDRAVFVTRPGGEVTFTFGANTTALKHPRATSAFWSAYLGADSPVGSMKTAVASSVAAMR